MSAKKSPWAAPVGSKIEYDLEAIQTDYCSYFQAVHPKFKVGEFQRKALFPALQMILDEKIDRLMIFMPPRHGKSTAATECLPPAYVGRYPGRHVITLSYSMPLARKFGRHTRDVFLNPTFVAAFPDAELRDDHRSATEFSTLGGSEVYYAGFDASVSGFAAHLLIIDEVCRNRADALSPVIQDGIRDLYASTFESRLEPGAAILFCTTRWTPGDLAGWRIVEDGAIDYFTGEPFLVNGKPVDLEGKPFPWTVLKLPFRATETEPWGRQKGEVLWPERFSVKDVEKVLRKDSDTISSLYQQEPSVGGGHWFNRDHLQFYKWKSLDRTTLNRYVVVDPANAKHKKADYTTLFAFGTGQDQNYYWMEMVRGRFDGTERQTELLRLHRRIKPIRVGYEEYGLMADTHYLRERQERENYRFPVITLGGRSKAHNVSKEERIKADLQPLSVEGRLWLPDPDDPDTPLVQAELVRKFIREEWEAAPNLTHDDMLDVMSRMRDDQMMVEFPKPAEDGPRWDQMGPQLGTTWLSS